MSELLKRAIALIVPESNQKNYLGFLFAWVVCTIVTAVMLVPNRAKFDFLSRWYGARMVLSGANPYRIPITLDMLNTDGLSEFAASIGPYFEAGDFFLYPITVVYVLLPFWLMPFRTAVSIWTGLLLALTITLPLFLFKRWNWQINPFYAVLIVALSLAGHFYSTSVILLGHFTTFVLACMILVWYLVVAERPAPGAIALVAMTVRPEGIILAGGIMIDLWLNGERRVPVYGLVLGLGLFVLSVLQIGWWPPDFFDMMLAYGDRGLGTYPAARLGHPWGTLVFTLLVAGWGGWFLWRLRGLGHEERLPWSLSVIIVTQLLIFPQSADHTLVLLLLPIWFLFSLTKEHRTFQVLLLMTLVMFWPSVLLYLATGIGLTHQLVTPILVSILLTYQASQSIPEHIAFRNMKGSSLT